MKKIFYISLFFILPLISSAQINPQEVKRIKEEISKIQSQANTADPKRADLFVKIGKLYSQINDADNAQISFEKALEIDPKNDEAHFMLALIFEKKKIDNKALEHWKKCLEFTSNASFKAIAEKHINYLSRK